MQEPTDAELAELPIFPLPDVVLFPRAKMPLHIFEPRYREMVRDVLAGGRLIAMARLKPGFETEYHGRPPIFEVCGLGRVLEHAELEDGRYNILLQGVRRVRVVQELPTDKPYRLVRAERADDAASADLALSAAWQSRLTSLWEELRPHLPATLRDLRDLTRQAESVGVYADIIAAAVVADPDERQHLLQELDPTERLRLLVERMQELSDALLQERPASKLN